MAFQSTKIIDGFSCCFRQWRAAGTHCRFLHGYGIYFKVWFEGDLDMRNWVVDFGFLKRSDVRIPLPPGPVRGTLAEWFRHMFDHTVVLAEDDPELEAFQALAGRNLIQLRVLPNVGCEMFAKLVLETLDQAIAEDTNYRVRVLRVECFEHTKNSAIYQNPHVHDHKRIPL